MATWLLGVVKVRSMFLVHMLILICFLFLFPGHLVTRDLPKLDNKYVILYSVFESVVSQDVRGPFHQHACSIRMLSCLPLTYTYVLVFFQYLI